MNHALAAIALSSALAATLLLFLGGIGVIGKDPARIQGSHAVVLTMFHASVSLALWTAARLSGSPLVWVLLAYTASTGAYIVIKGILHIGTRTERITPRQGLFLAAFHLTYVIAVATAMSVAL